jgi:hypothetical protein
VVSAPLFVGVVLVEAVARQGFDLVRMPLSLLSLGDAGWVQRANFIVCGLLFALVPWAWCIVEFLVAAYGAPGSWASSRSD